MQEAAIIVSNAPGERTLANLAELRTKVNAIQVRPGNREEYIEGGNQIAACKALIKLLEAGIASAKQDQEWLRVEKYCAQAKDQISQIKTIMAPLADKIRDWRAEERVEAKKEETQINKGVPKAERIKVEPNVPKVSGIVRRHNWSAEIVDEDKLLIAFLRGDGPRRKFLRQFICANQKKVAEFARDTQNSVTVEKLIPGVKTKEWDSV